ncbi:MAG: hypothetical protein KDK41_12555 [Leptospiraceae bacterium]|nr:hypothetical protein [Leptospiraceae bacterium]
MNKIYAGIILTLLSLQIGTNPLFSQGKNDELFKKAAELYMSRDIPSMKRALVLIEPETNILFNKNADSRLIAIQSLIYIHLNQLETMLSPDQAEYFNVSLQLSERAVSIERNAITLMALAKSYLVLGKFDEALKTAEEAIQSAPKEAELWYIAASASPGSISDSGSPAGEKMVKAINLNPKFIWPLEDIIQDAIKNRRKEVAMVYLAKLEQAVPDFKRLAFHKGLFQYNFGSRKAGIELLQEYMKSDPESIQAEKISMLLASK